MRILACLVALMAIASCTEQPSEPELDNLLDPAGPGGGDPFDLQGSYVGPDVELSWNDISDRFADLSGYNFYRSTTPDVDAGDFVGSVGLGSNGVATAADPSYNRDAVNYYKVAATRGSEVSSVAAVNAVSVYAPPSARLKNGRSTTPQPQIEMTLLPDVGSSGGDVFELSRSADFSTYDSYTDTGSDTPIVVDLGPTASADVEFSFFSRIRYAGGALTSPVGEDVLGIDLKISIDVPGALAGLLDTTAIVTLSDLTGVDRMRLAVDEGDLPAAAWVIPDSSFVAFPFHLPVRDSMVIHGEFETAFGFSVFEQSNDLIAPDAVGPAIFYLSNNDTTTTTAEIEITSISAPRAGYMRFSEDPGFAGVDWVPIALVHPFTLSATPGVKVVYGQFMSPFLPDPADWSSFVDGIVLLGAPKRRGG